MYEFLTTNEIKPKGWLKRQLEIEANGLAGNLDKVWPDVADSMWIGGSREGWERVPYWLDGFIPLAYLLENEDMIARAKRYIDKIVESQQPDGWICPNGNTPREKYDIWAIHLISKVLTVYYDCSRDERIPGVTYRVMKNFYELLENGSVKQFNWGKFRWFEAFIALNRLHEWYPNEEWIVKLAHILRDTGADYTEFMKSWERPLNKWTYYTHVVNLAMMIKSEAVSCNLLGEDYKALGDKLYDHICKFNGTVTGIFTGDECLSGLSPIQGTELCAVVELMYSFEWLYACTGDPKWAEKLEMLAFNALPATISDDMWTHQYVQSTNQIDCTPFPGRSLYRTNNNEAHLFGLEPHFGCCTSNFGQGWPKFALSAFMKAKDGLVSVSHVPCAVDMNWKGTPVSVTLEADAPSATTFTYTVTAEKKTSMKLRVRIPSEAKNITVNGEGVKKQKMLVFSGFNAGQTKITVSYSYEPTLLSRPNGLKALKYGSLLFSLPIKGEAKKVEYVKNGVERKFPYCDYHIKGNGDFNYAFTSKAFKIESREVSDIPFSSENPSIVAYADMCHIDWGYEEGFENVCAKVPNSTKPVDEPRRVTLYPYGCAKLRMTEMPLIKIK